MPTLIAARVIRRVRQRLELSQEGLSRLLNATKGAVQHWERGRNNPDLARLLALRQLCPPGGPRKELDALIRRTQAQVAPLLSERQGKEAVAGKRPALVSSPSAGEGLALLRKEHNRLQRQVNKLETALERRNEQLRILENVATDLQRGMAELRADHVEKGAPSRTPGSSEPN